MDIVNLFKSIVIMCISTVLVSSSSSNDNMDFIGFHTISHMPYAASDMAVVTFPEEDFSTNNGPRIYLTGGCVSDQTCNYDAGFFLCFCQAITNKVIYFTPEDNTWHTVNSVMPRSRYRHMAARVGNYLYVAGGRTLNDSLIPEIDRYDPRTDTWEANVFTWPDVTSDGGAFAVDDLLYLVGGYDGAYNTLANLTALNTSNGEWIVDLPSMQLGRGDIAVTAFEGNNFYVLGGWNAMTSNSFCNSSKDVEYYSHSTNTWTTVQDMELPRGDLAVGVMDGSIFAVGGETKDPADATCSYSIPIKYVERYHRAENAWNQEESIPDDLFRFSGISYNSSTNVYNSAIYLFGGQGTYDSTNMMYPVKDTTIKYIPRSTVHSKQKLSAGGIAGIVIAGIIVLGAIVVGVIAYIGYRRRYHYTNLNDIEAQQEKSLENQQNLELADIKESFEARL